MTCRSSRWLMALAAGGDLPGRKRRRWEKHQASCPACREEYRLFEAARAAVRSLARREATPDWSEAAWREAVDGAIGQARRPAGAPSGRLPGWAWAAAAGLLAALITGGVLVTRGRRPEPSVSAAQTAGADIILPDSAPRVPEPAGPAAVPVPARAAGRPPAEPPAQTVLAMTFVSQETGLTIHWTFNDKFTYEEENR